MSTQKRDSRGRFKKRTKRQRLSDNATKIICNVVWVVGVVSIAAILTASSLDHTEGLLVLASGAGIALREIFRT